MLIGVASLAAVVGGVCEQGLAAVWPLDAYSPHWQALWEPTFVEIGVIAMAIGALVIGGMIIAATGQPAVEPTGRERWSGLCLSGLILSLMLVGVALAFVVLGPSRGATAKLTGAVFMAGSVQSLLAFILVIGLLFLPKSKPGYGALVFVWLVEAGSLYTMYMLGTGVQA
jgi:ABC-type cobalt transport system substrate-binding protein